MPGSPEYPNYALPSGIPAPGPIPTYPAPYGTSQGGGTGGLVDKNKIINDSVQNAINETQQLQKMHRDNLAFKEQQGMNTAKKNAADSSVVEGEPAAPGAEHPGYFSNLMHGLSALGAGAKQIFGGAPAGIPTPPAAPPPAAIAANTPNAPAPAMPGAIPGMQAGGAVPQLTPFPMENGGGVPGNLVDKNAIINSGVQNAMDQTQQLQQMHRGNVWADADQEARGAMATASKSPQEEMVHQIDELHKDMHAHALGDDHVPNNSRGVQAPFDPTADPPQAPAAPAPAAQGVPTPDQAQGPAPAAPGPAGNAPPQGIAAPPADPNMPDPNDPKVQASAKAAASVVGAAPTDPAKTGEQVTSPSAEGKPHSITKEKWDEWDDRINKAVMASAQAGQDPGQVRQALEANRNAYIQGHVLRYLSSAHVAMQAGDTKGVEAAMKNAYYYMPNGSDLKIEKDPKTGQMLYQDPINPTKIDNNNVEKPNMIPVDAQHIELLGQAMLDPMQVNKTLMEIRTAHRQSLDSAAKRELEKQQGLAARDTGQGNLMKGKGILDTGEAHLGRVKSQNYKDLSEGDAALIRAKALDFKLRNTLHANKLDPQLIHGATEASKQFELAVQGQLTTVQGNPLTNPNVGKSTRDPTKSALPGATPRDVASGKAIAGQIYMGAAGSMSVGRAVELAVMAQAAQRGNTAKPDKNGKLTKSPDFHTDPKTGDSWVWNKAERKWETFKLPLTSANAAASGNLGVSDADLDDATKAELASNGGIGGGAASSQQSAANEPDMEDAKFPDAEQQPS